MSVASESKIYTELTEIFHDVFMREDISLRPNLTADDVEGWDSFKMIEIIMGVEERFQVKFSTKELDNLSNVGDLVRAIGEKAS